MDAMSVNFFFFGLKTATSYTFFFKTEAQVNPG